MLSAQHTAAVENFLATAIADTDLFVVEIKFLPTSKIEIFLDADSGVTIDKCSKVARFINKQLEAAFGEGLNYELEVSSAGLEHPLKFIRQYKKNIGRKLEITLKDESKAEGILTAADDEIFTIEFSLPKAKHKKETRTLKYDEVKETLVGVSF